MQGGLDIVENVKLTKINHETIQMIAKEYRICNCDIIFNCDANMDELIDVLEGNRKYLPCMYSHKLCA